MQANFHFQLIVLETRVFQPFRHDLRFLIMKCKSKIVIGLVQTQTRKENLGSGICRTWTHLQKNLNSAHHYRKCILCQTTLLYTTKTTSNDFIAGNGRVVQADMFIVWLYLLKKFKNISNLLKHKARPFPIKINYNLK